MRKKKNLLGVLLTLIIILMLSVPAFAFNDYGSIYDVTDQLNTDYMQYAAADLIPSFVEIKGFDLHIDIVDNLEDHSISDYARLFYEQYGYGYGEYKDGVHLMIYVGYDDNGLTYNDHILYYGGNGVDPFSIYEGENLFAEMEAALNAQAWAGDIQTDKEVSDLAIDAFLCGMEELLLAVNWENTAVAPIDTAASGESEALLSHVTDSAGLLTDSEILQLEERALAISQEYQCSIYIVTLDDFTAINSDGIAETGQQIFIDYNLGWGNDKTGIMLVLSMDQRDYALVAHGDKAHTAFTDYGKEALADDYFLDDFADNYWMGGFEDYLSGCEEYLYQAAYNRPIDIYGGGNSGSGSGGGSEGFFTAGNIIWIVVGATLTALIVCMKLRKKMKSVAIRKTAQEYVIPNGIRLTISEDRFSHTTQTRVRIKSDDNSSSGGGGTTINSSGFSSSSGKF